VQIIQKLIDSGLSDQWIMDNMGIEKDELLRLKQISGLASLFANNQFSDSWEEV
ncbi:chromosome partitioning protein ParB, partial [Enterococcus faecium]